MIPLVERVRSFFPSDFKGHALEIGASDGYYLSNTYALEKDGWEVLCIEPNPFYYEDLKDNRKLTLNVACSDKNEDAQPLLVYDRCGIPEVGWEGGEPVAALGGLEDRFIRKFCPDITPPKPHVVDVRTLDWCLDKVGFPRLDFLSLDVDGLEMNILRGFSIHKWNPKVVVVENPFSDEEIHTYLKDAGMSISSTTKVDEVWVRQ